MSESGNNRDNKKLKLPSLNDGGSFVPVSSADDDENSMQSTNRKPIKLKVHKKSTNEESKVKISTEFANVKTEVGFPAVDMESNSKSMSIADLINENISAETSLEMAETDEFSKQPGDSGEYLIADESHPPDATVPEEVKVNELECIECGHIAEVETGVETAKCQRCGGNMYPLGLFDGEDTISYFQPNEENPPIPVSPADDTMDDSKKSIKVAQPVSVGMFSSTATGTLNPAASSQNLKPMDFFSSTSSSTAPPQPSDSSPPAAEISSELMEEINREKMSLKEEWSLLKQQQEEFNTAIAEFEGKSQKLEQLRLELELKTASQAIQVDPNQATVIDKLTTIEKAAPGANIKNKNKILSILLVLIIIIQAAALAYLLFIKK